MKTAICILHYGDAGRTEKLCAALQRGDEDATILVLDNASPEPFPGAWVRLPENLYWAGALAWCLEALEQEGFSHVWFCNNDIMPVSAPPFLKRMQARMEKLQKSGKVGIISPSFSSNPYHEQMVHRFGGYCVKAVYVDGIAPFISLECVRRVGGVDFGENIYGYGVDVWLSYRASKSGWGVFVDHSLLFRHHYHTEAVKKDGFMALAAKAEDNFMRARLGEDWREKLQRFQGLEKWNHELFN